jgi:hypothetical protein
MKRHTRRVRLRRAAKWAGAVSCLAIAAVWVVSLWWSFGCVDVGRGLWGGWIGSGCFGIHHGGNQWPLGRSGWGMVERDSQVLWLPRHSHFRMRINSGWFDSRTIAVPLWMPFLAVALPTVWLFWRDRRTRLGHCACGYDLAGLAPGAPCPECGKAGA